MRITDEAGRPLAATDLNGAELRALRVLAAAGMTPPLDEPAAAGAREAGQGPAGGQRPADGNEPPGGQGMLIERDFSRPARPGRLARFTLDA